MLKSCLSCGAPFNNAVNQCPYCGGNKIAEQEIQNSKSIEIDKLFKLALFEIKNANYYNALTNIDEILKLDLDQYYAWFLKIKCEFLMNYDFDCIGQWHQKNEIALKKLGDNYVIYLSDLESDKIIQEFASFIKSIFSRSRVIPNDASSDLLVNFLRPSQFYKLKSRGKTLEEIKRELSDEDATQKYNRTCKKNITAFFDSESETKKYALPFYTNSLFLELILKHDLLSKEILQLVLDANSKNDSAAAAKRLALMLPYVTDEKIKYIDQFIILKNKNLFKDVNNDRYKDNTPMSSGTLFREFVNDLVNNFPSEFIKSFENSGIVTSEIQKSLNTHFTVIKKLKDPKAKSSGCFIATAALGDYNHPVVLDLREFRDNWLLKRQWGIKFTEWYYRHGPKAARLIKQSLFLRKIVFVILVKPLHILTNTIKQNG